ncbi:MAG: hypothetical protein L0I20_08260 [Lactococcus raffinolactis]|nr:hypothetical protein [Lactococcus raffinolactis]MDN6085652.1 hypothetical protein [Lactococcus plantarum]
MNNHVKIELDYELQKYIAEYMQDEAIADVNVAVKQALRERFVSYRKLIERTFATYQGDFVNLDGDYFVTMDDYQSVQSFDEKDYNESQLKGDIIQ